MLTEQYRPTLGQCLPADTYVWTIPLARKNVAAISVQGPPGMQFAFNGTPYSKINILNVGLMGAYELNNEDLMGIDISEIRVYITAPVAMLSENYGWPILVDVAYNPTDIKIQ